MFSLFKYFRKRDIIFIICIIAFVILQVYADLTMPDFTSKITELIALEKVKPGTLKINDILYNGGMMVLCAFGSFLCFVLSNYLASIMSADWSKQLRQELINKVLTFSDEEINHFTTPSLITRTTNDVVHCQNFAAMGTTLIIKAPVTAIWAICKISTTATSWTIATMSVVLAILIVVTFLIIYALPKFRKIQKLTDNLNDSIRENLTGVRVIRAFNAESFQSEKYEKINNEITDNNLKTSRSLSVMMPFMMLCMSSITVIIYILGAILINDAALKDKPTILGNMTAYTSISIQLIMAFIMLVVIFVLFPRTMVSANRIKEVLNYTVKIKDGNNNEKEGKETSIEFKNVSFSYTDDLNHCVLKDINFKLNKGETLAIIGSTGSGKTTIVNLLLRFLEVSEGEILLNSKNIKDYKLDDLNNHLSIAPQKATLFSGTIKSNITYGSDNFDEERFNKAIETSSSSFIDKLKDKENSFVAQGGTNYSGGQKQRLSIARALYKNSDILIFDDTFSALDYKTDMLVRKNIKKEYSDKTVIIVAQRIGTIRQADKIIVLDKGKIVGIGKHEELLKTCNVYKDIALSQLSKKELNVKEEK